MKITGKQKRLLNKVNRLSMKIAKARGSEVGVTTFFSNVQNMHGFTLTIEDIKTGRVAFSSTLVLGKQHEDYSTAQLNEMIDVLLLTWTYGIEGVHDDDRLYV